MKSNYFTYLDVLSAQYLAVLFFFFLSAFISVTSRVASGLLAQIMPNIIE